MLEVVGKDIISGNMGFIGTDPDRLYRMGAAEKTEDVTVTGNPAVLDNATGKPFKDLHIYGRSEQVTTTGAQLLDLDAISLATGGGATIKRLDDGGFLVDGTPEQAYEQYITKVVINLAPGTYFVSGGRAADGCAAVQINILNADGTRTYKNNASFDVLGTEQEITLVIQSVSEKPINNYKIYPMINSGSVALPFEPYTGGKPSPSPDYPQEIVSAGDDGNLNVMVRGKNIFPGPEQPKTLERNGLTFSYKDGMYALTGTSTENTWFNIYPVIDKTTSTSQTHNGNTICSDGKIAVVNGLKNKLCNIAFRNADDKNRTTIITASNNKKLLQHNTSGVFIYAPPGSYSDTFTLMITDENQTEDYEPYHNPQTLTLSTPNGLPGIPVTSGGNYTDENGQQWICDEVDLGRGVYVKRVYTVDVDGANVYFSQYESFCNMSLRMLPMCKYASDLGQETLAKSTFTSEKWKFNDTERFLYILKGDYAEILNESCKKHPGEVIYTLATPIETPLTAAEIAAYKSLRTYRGTTIVEAEDKAGISVTYKRNAKTDNISAEKKIEESEKKEYDES